MVAQAGESLEATGTPARPVSSYWPSGGSSSGARANARSCSCSTTSTGPSRRCSTSSSSWPRTLRTDPRGSASRDRNCATSDPGWPRMRSSSARSARSRCTRWSKQLAADVRTRSRAGRRERRRESALRRAAGRLRPRGRRDRRGAALGRGADRSRLDLLEPEERAVLAARGRRRAALPASCGGGLSPPNELADRRDTCWDSRRRASSTAAATVSRFHHVLVRDVAYASMPKAERAELHERLADWLDERGEADELVGHHLEQAHCLRAELGRSTAVHGASQPTPADGWARRGSRPGSAATRRPRSTCSAAQRAPPGERLRSAGALLRARRRAARRPASSGEPKRARRAADTAATPAIAGSSCVRASSSPYVRLFTDPGGQGRRAARRGSAGDARLRGGRGRPLALAGLADLSFVQGAMRCRYAAAVEATERALDHHAGPGGRPRLDSRSSRRRLPRPNARPEAIRRCHGCSSTRISGARRACSRPGRARSDAGPLRRGPPLVAQGGRSTTLGQLHSRRQLRTMRRSDRAPRRGCDRCRAGVPHEL